MSVTVVLTKTVGEEWATDEEFSEMTDEQIVELLQEDIGEFLERARWEIRRRP